MPVSLPVLKGGKIKILIWVSRSKTNKNVDFDKIMLSFTFYDNNNFIMLLCILQVMHKIHIKNIYMLKLLYTVIFLISK